jgi:hypothetical protein
MRIRHSCHHSLGQAEMQTGQLYIYGHRQRAQPLRSPLGPARAASEVCPRPKSGRRLARAMAILESDAAREKARSYRRTVRSTECGYLRGALPPLAPPGGRLRQPKGIGAYAQSPVARSHPHVRRCLTSRIGWSIAA